MAEKNRCYLCGGKLRNGYCDSCGLDNERVKRIRYRLNESTTAERLDKEDEQDLIRQMRRKADQHQKLHEKLDKERNQAQRKYKAEKAAGQNAFQLNIPKVNRKEKAVTGKIRNTLFSRTKMGVIVAIVIAVIGVMQNVIGDMNEEYESHQEIEAEEYDPYEYETEALAEEGDFFETELYQGAYLAGVHIPEGKYTVELLEGYGNLSIQDNENGIYIWQSFGDDEEYGEVFTMTDVRLHQGAKIEIRDSVKLRFTSANAQTEKMQPQGNPLITGNKTERIELKVGQSYVVGEDFPAGVYDVSTENGWGSLNYTIPTENEYTEEGVYSYGVFLDSEDLRETYQNLVLPEGANVTVEEKDMFLTPSPVIGSEDYRSYYDE